MPATHYRPPFGVMTRGRPRRSAAWVTCPCSATFYPEDPQPSGRGPDRRARDGAAPRRIDPDPPRRQPARRARSLADRGRARDHPRARRARWAARGHCARALREPDGLRDQDEEEGTGAGARRSTVIAGCFSWTNVSHSRTSSALPRNSGVRSCSDSGLDVRGCGATVARGTPGLLGDERERCGLVEHAQLAVGVLAVAGVEEDPAVEQVAVEVGDQRADVARAVGPAWSGRPPS